tara:strand:- start:2202 stop:2453 length:252 start_codon:yes stop_codon:yes gene_type:complete
MILQINTKQKQIEQNYRDHSRFNDEVFTKDYVDFLNEAGWILEKKLPSNNNHYSDLMEDTDWEYNYSNLKCSKHYRRDLDALS